MNFPITSNIVLPGSDRTVKKVIDKGYIVRCWWCKEPFIVDEQNAKVTDKYGNVALVCPVCEKMCSVLYYYDQARPATRRDKNMIYQRSRRRRLKQND